MQMTSGLALDQESVAGFLGPGTSPDLLRNLLKAQIKKRLLQLAAIRRQLAEEAPGLAEQSGFERAYSLLKEMPTARLTSIISYPSFGQWCATMAMLLGRKAHINLQEGHVTSHLGLLSNFAVAGALATGLPVQLEAWLDDRASMPLPCLRATLTAPLQLAGKKIRCSVTASAELHIAGNDLPEASFAFGEDATETIAEAVIRLRQMPLLAGRFELNDFDQLLQSSDGYNREERFDLLDPMSAKRWQQMMQVSWQELCTIHPQYAREIGQYVNVIVPLKSADPNIHVSSTAKDSFGMVQMSYSDRPLMLAEALVHEYHHNKLNAILDLDPLIIDPERANLYYSPWRDDARPLRGLLHGAFAFQAITHFWWSYLDSHQEGEDRDRAEHEYTRRRAQTLAAIEALRSQAQFTPAGEVMMHEMQRQMQSLPPSRLPDALQRKISDDLASHKLRWQRKHAPKPKSDRLDAINQAWVSSGGILGEPGLRPHIEGIEPQDAYLKQLGQEFGAPEGILINRLDQAHERRDHSLDHLSLLSVREPEQFEKIAVQVATNTTSTDPLQRLFEGHIAYVRGDYSAAARKYAEWITIAPYNIDAWRDFVFALRHMGLKTEANVVLFHPELVVQFAEQAVPEVDRLRMLMREDDDLPSAFSTADRAAAYLLMLRWLARVLPQ
jgi:HEXXH motif-containing protein